MNARLALPNTVVQVELVQSRILILRDERVIIDADLAALYEVPTKRLNEQVKRNADRFPGDFSFRLTSEEARELVANCDRFTNLKHSSLPPLAFTEHGALMAATVLNSPRAVQMSVFIVRAFVQLRGMLASHKDLAQKMTELERKYDSQFKTVFDAIRQLMEPPALKKKPIGF